MQKEDVQFSLEDFLNNLDKFSAKKQRQLFLKLQEFAESTVAFEEIGDFGPGQVIWNSAKWILLDFSSSHKKADLSYESRKTVLTISLHKILNSIKL